MRYYRLTLILLACLFSLSALAEEKAKPVETKGLFNVIKQDADYYFDVPDALLSRQLLATMRFISTPADTRKYGGEAVTTHTIYFQLAPDNKLLMRSNILVSHSDTLDQISKAVRTASEDPILAAFKVEKRTKGYRRIKVTEFLRGDAIGMPPSLKSQFGVSQVNGQLSYIDTIKTFPENTEVRLVRTYYGNQNNTHAGRMTGNVTFGLNLSFVLLPEQPYQRRLFDPRVGYFTDNFSYYSDNQQRVQPRNFITRWRLEPKDSAAIDSMRRGYLVEPKKPIVYYIDPATPKQWRPYLIQGVNDWQKAFEQAGFKNAIRGEEWPNDSTMSMEDARYSVIRYLASDIPNAYGPQIHDPRSGEILESHICWYHNVMTLVHDWYMIQAGNLDEAAQKMKYDPELMGQLVRFVSSHEVGHTLGLRHNFGSSSTVPVDSLRNKAWVEAHGHTPSIMDYARFNYVAQPEDSIGREGIFPRIGDYDKWAIQWGYTPMLDAYDEESDHWELEKLIGSRLRDNRRLWFGDGETNKTNDPRCQTEDLGDDVVKASEYGILNLKRELKVLPEWTYESNDIALNNLNSVYKGIVQQFLRYTNHVVRHFGGVECNWRTIDEAGDTYVNTSRQKQEQCMAFLKRHYLEAAPRWLIDQPYIKRITPQPEQYMASLGRNLVSNLTGAAVLERLTDEYPATDFLSDIEAAVMAPASPDYYQRILQNTYVQGLCEYYKAAGGTTDPTGAASAVLQRLRQLQKRLSATPNPHLQLLKDKIDRTLKI